MTTHPNKNSYLPTALILAFSISYAASESYGDPLAYADTGGDDAFIINKANIAQSAPGNPADFACDTLDTGIYWFGPGNVAQKHIPGIDNAFFDPDSPTVIFAHGWQNGVTSRGFRETYNYLANDPRNGVDVNTADAWIDAGWNIGIFYWSQLADEGEVKDAEAKIWTTEGRRGMRWRQCDGSPTTAQAPQVAVGEIFYQAYLEAMAEYRGPNIRLVGHSLGNQVVTRLAHLILQDIVQGNRDPALLPQRIALLDPFWSNGRKDYLDGKWTGELAREFIADLIAEGVVFERYKTSNINDFFIGDRNRPLTRMIGETEIIPGYIINLDQPGRHISAPNLYFHSFASPPPPACDGACNQLAASAATSDARIRELMDEASRWIQIAGERTEDPADNMFELR